MVGIGNGTVNCAHSAVVVKLLYLEYGCNSNLSPSTLFYYQLVLGSASACASTLRSFDYVLIRLAGQSFLRLTRLDSGVPRISVMVISQAEKMSLHQLTRRDTAQLRENETEPCQHKRRQRQACSRLPLAVGRTQLYQHGWDQRPLHTRTNLGQIVTQMDAKI